MAEQLDLASPAQTAPGTNNWRPVLLHLDWEKATIKVGFRGENGEYTSVGWGGAEATTLMVALNKANLSSNSLHKRIMNQAITDGKLAGTITGTPD
jgi:hypothetical protein